MMIPMILLVDPDYYTVRMCSRAFQNDWTLLSYAVLLLQVYSRYKQEGALSSLPMSIHIVLW